MRPRRRRSRLAFLASAVLLLPASGQADGAPAGAEQRAKGAVLSPPGETGTLETLAGPQFCPVKSRVEPDSGTVRSVAVTPQSELFFDTGDPDKGRVARIEPSGRASIISAGLPAPMPPRDPGKPSHLKGPLGSRMAPDHKSGVFVATATTIVRVAKGLSTIAGEDPPAHTASEEPDAGHAGPAPESRFNEIMSIASDGAGNLYVADRAGDNTNRVRIRFINNGTGPSSFYSGVHQISVPAGHIATVAGARRQEGTQGAPPALYRSFEGIPPALAAEGPLLYIASHSVKTSSSEAASPSPASKAENPPGLSPKPANGKESATHAGLHLANLGGEVIRAHGLTLEPGAVELLAGGPTGYAGDGGPAATARFSYISGMAVDGKGNLYLADQLNHRIRKLDAGGTITTFAGDGPGGPAGGGFNGNGGPAGEARLNHPFDVKIGAGDVVYISDFANGQIRVVGSSGIIQAAPGKGIGREVRCLGEAPAGAPRDAGASNNPEAGAPFGIVSSANGDVFFTNLVGGRVKRIVSPGTVETAAGTGSSIPVCQDAKACTVTEGGRALRALLKRPSRLALARSGLYILDAGDFRIRFVNLSARPVTRNGIDIDPGRIATVAGNGTMGSSGDGGKATAASIDPNQADIAAGFRGSLYLSDPTNRKLRLIDAAGKIRAVAGPGRPLPGSGCCPYPQSLTVDARGNMYISETVQSRIWLWNRGSEPVVAHGTKIASRAAEPVAGTGVAGFEGDGGPAIQANLIDPAGLAVDRRRNLYIADRTANNVRKVDSGGRITTVAGTGQAGFNGDGLKAGLTWLAEPYDLAIDSCQNLLIADSGNSRVRRLIVSSDCDRPRPSPGQSREKAFSVPLVLIVTAVLVAAFLGGAYYLKSEQGRNT